MTLLTDDQESRAFASSVLVAPVVAGLVVCRVGRWSVLYRGRCGAAVAGAYVGALGGTLAGLLLGFAGCSGASATTSSGDGGSWGGNDDCFTGVIIAGSIGYVLGTATGALVGWNISKQPNDPPVTDAANSGPDPGHDRRQALAVGEAAPRLSARPSAALSPRVVIFPIFAAAF